MKFYLIIFLFFFTIATLNAQNQVGARGGICLSKYDYEEFIEGKIFFHSTTCISETGNSVIKENMRIKKKVKGSLKNKLKRLVKHNKSDTAKKPESFWTTVALGLSFAALMLFLNVPIAMLFFFTITGIGLGGYYIFRKKHKKIAEAFLTIATALNLGLGVVALYAMWLSSVVD